MYKFRTPRKNQHWVYFYHSNLKVGPFGPPPVALGLSAAVKVHLRFENQPKPKRPFLTVFCKINGPTKIENLGTWQKSIW